MTPKEHEDYIVKQIEIHRLMIKLWEDELSKNPEKQTPRAEEKLNQEKQQLDKIKEQYPEHFI